MAEYTRLDQDQLNGLLENYDLGVLEKAAPLAGGQANSSYKLTTDKGNFTLSVCDEKTTEEIETLTQVLDCLESHGFPATRLVRTKPGAAFVTYQTKPVYVKEFLEGQVCRGLSPAMLEQIGRSMALLHSIPAPKKLPQAFPYGLTHFDEVLESDITHPFKDWLKEKTAFLKTSLDLSMAQGFIHGDIFWDNLLFEKNKLKAVLDFEEACHYFLLYDLGMAAVGCCANANGFALDKIRQMLEGYTTMHPLSGPEKKQFKPFLVYAATAAAFWRFRQYNIRYPDQDKSETYKELSNLADQAMDMDDHAFFDLKA